MDELKIHDNVFPFVCDNCNSEYDLEGFKNVVLLWGFIYLTKGEHSLIGMTCPDCHYTTLRKYPLNTPDFSMETLEKSGIKYYVSFSAKMLTDLSLITSSKLQGDENKEDSYRIPLGFKSWSYYKDDESFIVERIIPELLKIENEYKYKAFPRVVPPRSVYQHSEYYKNGKPFRESSKSTKKMVAKKLLDRREGEIAQGKVPGVQFEKISYDDLAEDFLRDYRINKKRSLDRAERSVKHLNKYFEGDKVPTITTPRINKYIEKRQEEGAANATINRELSALKRMLNIGAQQTPPLVDRVPKIHMLDEDNVRTGFFEHNEFLKFRDALPFYLKGFTTFGYKFGWRVEEIADLTWSQVDRRQWGVRLEVGTTKNKGGRLIFLDSELKEIFKQLWAQRKASNRLLIYVFPNRRGDGKIKDFRFVWNKAFKESKVEHKLFHDLRRTAVRNMIRAGIPEKVAMLISGHKTRSVFERYNIVDEKDLKLATEQQEKYFESVAGTISGTVHDLNEKRNNISAD